LYVAIPAALPVTVLLALHGPLLVTGWFHFDDLYIFRQVNQYGIVPHFFQPAVWLNFSSVNFAPWTLLSNGVDFYLFGLQPWGHFAHHLTSLIVVIALAYAVLARFWHPWAVALALSALVLSPPLADLAQTLSLRHYLEGMGLMLVGFLGFHLACEQQRGWPALWGALAYFGACLAKEIYVPLVLALLFMPNAGGSPLASGWRGIRRPWATLTNPAESVRYWLPFALAATLYTAWRLAMLHGQAANAYGAAAPPLRWADIGQLPAVLTTTLVPPTNLLAASALVLGLAGLLLAAAGAVASQGKKWQSPRAMTALVWLGLAIAPILPVLPILRATPTPRYLLMLVWLLCLAIAWAMHACLSSHVLGWKRVGLAAMAMLLAAMAYALHASPVWQERALFPRYRAEGELLLYGQGQDTLVLDPLGVSFHLWSLMALREEFLHQPPGPLAFYDACLSGPTPTQTTRFADGVWQREPFTPPPCQAQPQQPLTLRITARGRVFHWAFGPYSEGRYTIFVLADDSDTIQVRTLDFYREAHFPFVFLRPTRFIVRYTSPQGWYTDSPPWRFDPAHTDTAGQVVYHR